MEGIPRERFSPKDEATAQELEAALNSPDGGSIVGPDKELTVNPLAEASDAELEQHVDEAFPEAA